MSIHSRSPSLAPSSSPSSLYHIKKRVWESSLPVIINSGSGIDEDRPFAVMAMRISYFPLLLNQLSRHFDRYFTEKDEEDSNKIPWFEWSGIALSWTYPIGHLFDKYQPPVPWKINLRFDNFPTELVPLFDWKMQGDDSTIASHFYSSLKQSFYLRYGSSRCVMNLPRKDHIQLWDSILSHSYERFWEVFGKLQKSEFSFSTTNGISNIPLKFYCFREGIQEIKQALFSSNLLLRECIEICFGEKFGSYQFIIHGVQLDTNTPISWLEKNFIFPDGFLYIIARCRNE